MSRCVISLCGRTRLSEQLLHTIRKMASEADRAIRENLHAGIAA